MITVRIKTLGQFRTCLPRLSSFRNYSDDEKTKDDKKEKPPKGKPAKKDDASNRLNKLLMSMQTDDNKTLLKSVTIPKAGARKERIQKKKREEIEVDEDKPKNLAEAAKKVAETIGGERKREVESELLSKLLNHIENTSNPAKLESDGISSENETSLKDILSGMKIDKNSQQEQKQSRGEFVRQALHGRSHTKDVYYDGKHQGGSRRIERRETRIQGSSVKLFDNESLNIFITSKDELNESVDSLRTWKYLHERELQLSITHPPANYFQKMALWTDQGKVWKFPIDNEQGLEEEAKVDFSEHVLLEEHLENWCPTKGPVRHFMELVCVGLSKNPYLTVQEKKDHIFWYKDYFMERKELLDNLIASKQSDSKPPQIQADQ